MRNATTDSPWPVSNNPRAKYNDAKRPDSNLCLPLWQLVRASTAALTYFPPETIQVGARHFVFVDGAVTMYNNPSFQLFLMATVEPYQLCWAAGEREMLLVSIGTGSSPDANANLVPGEMNLVYNATSIPSALMLAASNEQDLLCRVFGRTRYGDLLERELGDLITPSRPLPSGRIAGPVNPKLFTYMRYNVELTRTGLDLLGLTDITPEDVQQIDSVDHVAQLSAVGAELGKKVKKDHFDGFLE